MRYKTRQALIGVVVFSSGILLSRAAAAQQPAVAEQPAAVTGQPAAPSAAEEQAQLENCVRVMKGELERAEARAKAVTAQLVSLDEDIESRMNRIVSLLSSVRDSSDTSSTRMRMAKEDAIEGLKATALYYARERDKRRKAMSGTSSQLSDDDLAKDIAALNARIEVRVAQSLDVATSLTQHEEGRIDKHADQWTNYAIETPEYKKTERDARESVKIKADLVADLRASIDKLTREKKALEAELRQATDPGKVAQLSKDIEEKSKTVEARRSQIEELVTASGPATRPVSQKAGFEMDKMLDEMTAELKKDFAAFKRLVAERDAARARVKPLKERLEKVTALLEKKQTSGQ